MNPSATAADEFKFNFWTAIRDLMANDPDTDHVYVCYGAPGTFEPAEIVSFGDLQSSQDPATISTNRSREETLTLTVEISCARAGGADQELVAAQRAYLLLRMIEKYVRQTDTTLGGTVRHCFLISHDSAGMTDPSVIENGRLIEITARFQARARIT